MPPCLLLPFSPPLFLFQPPSILFFFSTQTANSFSSAALCSSCSVSPYLLSIKSTETGMYSFKSYVPASSLLMPLVAVRLTYLSPGLITPLNPSASPRGSRQCKSAALSNPSHLSLCDALNEGANESWCERCFSVAAVQLKSLCLKKGRTVIGLGLNGFTFMTLQTP